MGPWSLALVLLFPLILELIRFISKTCSMKMGKAVMVMDRIVPDIANGATIIAWVGTWAWIDSSRRTASKSVGVEP